jgi:gliding motility-associated-like protein
LTITGDAILCADETSTLDATPSNLEDLMSPTYSWTLDGNPIAGDMATLDITQGGTYEVTVDNNGCTETSSFDVELIDYQVSLPIPQESCIGQGETVTLSAEFTGLTQEEIDNDVSYLWTTSSGTETTPTIEVTEAGTYTLTTTFKGCEETATETFTFFNNPIVSINGMMEICSGDTNTLDATPMNLNDLVSPSYSWTLNGEPISGDSPILDITQGGTYEITVDNNGCTQTASFEVELIDFTSVTILTDTGDNSLCTGGGQDTLVLSVALDGALTPDQENQINYQWSDNSTGETLTVSESGTYSVEVDINGNCIKSDAIEISIVETVGISIQDVIKCPEDEVTLTPVFSPSPSEATYTWTKPDGQTETGPTLTTSVEGDYTLTVNNQGCISTTTVNVGGYAVDNCVITQGISPDFNNDGKNDCMDLTWLSDESGIRKMTVFNRYGRRVFEADNYVDTFCGQDENGNTLETGTYFYVIELENPNDKFDQTIKGWVYVNTEQ